MKIEFENIPARFLELHRRYFQRWISQCDPRDTMQVHPHEPLGAVDLSPLAMPESIPTITFIARKKTLPMEPGDWGRRYAFVVSPMSAHDSKEIDAWCAKHKDTTNEQFEWFPFDKRGA